MRTNMKKCRNSAESQFSTVLRPIRRGIPLLTEMTLQPKGSPNGLTLLVGIHKLYIIF